jgi:hypothetical protein
MSYYSFKNQGIVKEFRGELTSIDQLAHATTLAARVDFGVSKLGELVAGSARDICALVHGFLEGIIFPTEDVVTVVSITVAIGEERGELSAVLSTR